MQIMNPTIKDIIYKKLREESVEESKKHVKSGKLSAGKLGSPLQHQILSALKVESKVVDNYTLGKFKRGQEVETFIVKMLEKDTYNTQVECNYRDCVGFLDVELYGEKWNTTYLPLEVKSVTNAAFKWLWKGKKSIVSVCCEQPSLWVSAGEDDDGKRYCTKCEEECRTEEKYIPEAKQGHKLQAGLYAVALNLPLYSVLYVAADDYRTMHLIYETADIKDEIDNIIDIFNTAWKSKTIPVFEAKEKWQEKIMYNNYPFFMKLSEEQLNTMSGELFKNV